MSHGWGRPGELQLWFKKGSRLERAEKVGNLFQKEAQRPFLCSPSAVVHDWLTEWLSAEVRPLVPQAKGRRLLIGCCSFKINLCEASQKKRKEISDFSFWDQFIQTALMESRIYQCSCFTPNIFTLWTWTVCVIFWICRRTQIIKKNIRSWPILPACWEI